MMVLNAALAREAESCKHSQVLEQGMRLCNTYEEIIGIRKESGAGTTFFSIHISNYLLSAKICMRVHKRLEVLAKQTYYSVWTSPKKRVM
jgi:hypothetical protein